MATKATADTLISLMTARRTYYALNKTLPISNDRVTEIVKEIIKQTPSSFNSQSTRAVVLFGAEHEKLWDFAIAELKKIVPAENWKTTGDKLSGFRAAAGSVLFFTDNVPVKALQDKFATYAPKFPGWATQTNAMSQFAIWTALEAEGLGANLQHYNPVIDAQVASEWKIPENWTLDAQLVFGGIAAETYPKDFAPIDERVKSYGA
ncbi:putative nitroreductase HBN1 [Ceratocystis lukuohia]|uniref:Nitroreductase HBN1 n=1 Tax=Ceratocystis lukuohia TaxID=2019550 RepID=A0ABR4MIV6_9PEZI